MEKQLVSIKEKYVNCSLQLRNFDSWGVAGSDFCQYSASSGVLMENGSVMWRCNRHKGIRDIRTGELGHVVTEVATMA